MKQAQCDARLNELLEVLVNVTWHFTKSYPYILDFQSQVAKLYCMLYHKLVSIRLWIPLTSLRKKLMAILWNLCYWLEEPRLCLLLFELYLFISYFCPSFASNLALFWRLELRHLYDKMKFSYVLISDIRPGLQVQLYEFFTCLITFLLSKSLIFLTLNIWW